MIDKTLLAQIQNLEPEDLQELLTAVEGRLDIAVIHAKEMMSDMPEEYSQEIPDLQRRRERMKIGFQAAKSLLEDIGF